ncbi:hypothetical protein [Flavobacterium faecale]|uniref:hypothetical protein n=1 Tax=Flavobacterium faecale TaxID=1355330 RepID=UPI00131F1F98|nr:hypothetical protein [Flavobacterium faecale]
MAQIKTANPNKIDEIIKWGNDGKTTKIIFPAGVFEFPKAFVLSNENLIFEGNGIGKTILKLGGLSPVLIDAKGNNYKFSNLTLDGGMNQKGFGNVIFSFNKSKGHQFENVEFTNSKYNAISAAQGYATDGLIAKKCIFSNIEFICIQIFNRNTAKRNGKVIVSVDKVLIDSCVFKEGYETAITSDNGNDREDSGNGTGRRYTESTSLNGTLIQNCTFEKSKQFHIGMVQTENVIIRNNNFAGMTDDAGTGCQPIHVEQFCHNLEIYDNVFNMSNTVSKAYNCINITGIEGHKRVTQERPSSTYASWTYNIDGGNKRRANVQCAKTGNIEKDCKRDVHAYGPRNIFIAGNTFNTSTKIDKYVFVGEGENIQIGTKKDGTISLNKFMGIVENKERFTFSGNDEGCGNVLIRAGQNVSKSNVGIKEVSFDLEPIRKKKPIVIE